MSSPYWKATLRRKFRYLVLKSEDRFPLCHVFEHEYKKKIAEYIVPEKKSNDTILSRNENRRRLVGWIFFFLSDMERMFSGRSKRKKRFALSLRNRNVLSLTLWNEKGASTNNSKNLIVSQNSPYIEKAVALNTDSNCSDRLSNTIHITESM